MNIQQLEYIVAVDNYRHFAKAADASFVTQPTLSMMIQKLESELDVKIFDRSRQPVQPTLIGSRIIEQARVVLKNVRQIKEVVHEEKTTLTGSFKLGVIPTIASYLIPELLSVHQQKYGFIELVLQERTTAEIIQGILSGELDGGLLAGPLNRAEIVEYPIYYEKFYAYVSPKEPYYKEVAVDLEAIDINALWLLEDVHCFRGQIQRLCQLKKKSFSTEVGRYEAGSVDTLINIVDLNRGLTIIPEMTAMNLSEDRQANLRELKDLTAVREVSLMVGQEFVRKRMLEELISMVKASVPRSMQNPELKSFVIDL